MGDELVPATYKCFDCGYEKEGQAGSISWFSMCPECETRGFPGMMLVYTLDGKPGNRLYFARHEEAQG